MQHAAYVYSISALQAIQTHQHLRFIFLAGWYVTECYTEMAISSASVDVPCFCTYFPDGEILL